jgi:hypothetical protein
MNNLNDISVSSSYGSIAGYTQDEIKKYFYYWIKHTAKNKNISEDNLLLNMKDYYDGFCFDGKTKVYNPFSVLNFFDKELFKNYWYSSASPSFIVHWMQKHHIYNPEEYRHFQVDINFTESHEIENADPASFLYQSGYLTIEKIDGDTITLDYPNKEVLISLSRMYLNDIYKIKDYIKIGKGIWDALEKEDFQSIVDFYNTFLAEIPYDGLGKRNEYWYRALFLLLLRCVGIIGYAEVHTAKGRSDIVVQLDRQIIVIEFKLAENAEAVDSKRQEGISKIRRRGYAKAYEGTSRKVASVVIVANDELRQATL